MSLPAHSQEFIEQVQTVRQLSMGGVYVFEDGDAAGFLQNPAYSCFSTGINWSIFDLNAGINGLQIATDLQDAGDISGIDDLAPLYGKRVWVGVGAHSTIMAPCFGMSAWDYGFTSLILRNPSFPALNITLINDYAFQIGGGIPIGPNFAFGLSAKRVTRRGGSTIIGAQSLTDASTSSIMSALENEGHGYGLDAGVVFRAEALLLDPSLSLSWQDVGSTSFLKSKGDAAPDRQKDNLTAAVTIGESFAGFGLAGGLEYRHITDQGTQLGQKLHLGAEISLPLINVRGGFHQGYNSYGVGLDLWLLEFDAAVYSVEKGYYPGQSEEQRIQLGIKFNVGFDPSFMLVDLGNAKKRRKLKVRR